MNLVYNGGLESNALRTLFTRSFLIAGIFFAIFSFLVGCSTSTTGSAIDAVDALDSGEASLFSDGPVSLPVTIAKLQSPNSEQIALSVTELGISNLVQLTTSKTLSTDETYSCEFTGNGHETDATLRAIPDPVTTPYVLIYNAISATSVIESVATDGSFSAVINCHIEENLAVAAVTSDSLTTAQASPYVIFSVDELGTITITITNSNLINENQPFGADPYGSIIFSVIEDDGTYTVWRRNLDGSLPDRLLENHVLEPIAVVAMADIETEGSVIDPTVVLMDRGVNLTKIEESDDGEIFTASTLADAIGTIPDDENNGQTKRYGILPITPESILLARPTVDDVTHVLEVYETSDGNVTTIIDATLDGQPTVFAEMLIAFKDLAHTTVAVRTIGETTTNIYRLDLVGDGEDAQDVYESAWQNKTDFILNLPYYVHSLNPTTSGVYVLAESPTTGQYELGRITQNGGYTSLINVTDAGLNPYPRIFVVSDSSSAILCDQGEVPGESDARFLLIDLSDTSDGFIDFATNSKLRSCNHMRATTMQSTGNRLLHFFTQEEGDTASQMSYINLTTNEIVRQYTP